MNCGHLFNGIGGFALAAYWMGWSNIMHCEIDPFCNKVMKKHFPDSYEHTDIRTTDFTIWRGKLDIITGGFPCQPFSVAGARQGTEDDRHLWPQMLRAIREIQPRWVVGENVRGITNWNGGLVFDQVQADLEAEGYEVLPFLLPAAGVGAPHRRDRIWFVAYNISQFGYEKGRTTEYIIQGRKAGEYVKEGGEIRDKYTSVSKGGIITNPNRCQRCEGRLYAEGSEAATGHACTCDTRYDRTGWQDFPTQSPVCNRNDGLSFGLVNISFSKWRNESLKALGNAIVPQVAFEIFKAIEAHEQQTATIHP